MLTRSGISSNTDRALRDSPRKLGQQLRLAKKGTFFKKVNTNFATSIETCF